LNYFRLKVRPIQPFPVRERRTVHSNSIINIFAKEAIFGESNEKIFSFE
jgi:hypothetical protein